MVKAYWTKEGNKNVYNEDVNDRYPVSSDLKKNEIVFVKGTLSGMVIPQSKGPGEDATHLKLIPYQRNTKIICILWTRHGRYGYKV